MSFNEIDGLLSRLYRTQDLSTSANWPEHHKVHYWYRRAHDIAAKTVALGQLLEAKNPGFVLDLSTDQIDWESMPKEVSSLFRPEFEHNPQDIKGIEVRVVNDRRYGYHGVNIFLERQHSWSSLRIYTFMNENEHLSGVEILDIFEGPQLDSVRKAKKALGRLKPNSRKSPERTLEESIISLDLQDRVIKWVFEEERKKINV